MINYQLYLNKYNYSGSEKSMNNGFNY